MRTLKRQLARGVGSHFVWLSFSLPGLLETRGFIRFMNRLFTRLAPSYDRLGEKLASHDVVLGPVRSALQSLSAVPRNVLDLACGTGLATFAAAALFPGARIVAADLSVSMIEELRRKAGESGRGGLMALVCNSARLPFGEGCFDLVMTQNAPPYLDEMLRVLRPGGTLVLAYSFVFAQLLRPMVTRRMKGFDLIDIRVIEAEDGMALVASREGSAKG